MESSEATASLLQAMAAATKECCAPLRKAVEVDALTVKQSWPVEKPSERFMRL